jgi:hypothetical protein
MDKMKEYKRNIRTDTFGKDFINEPNVPKSEIVDWTHPADGRPSGSSLQAVEQAGESGAVEQKNE